MNLLRYLVAPHEQNQQQIPGLSNSAPAPTRAHHVVANDTEGLSYSSLSRRPSVARPSQKMPRDVAQSWPNEILATDPEGMRFSTQHGSASERATSRDSYQVSAQAPLHPEVLDFLAQHRPSSTSVASYRQAESAPAQVIHPGVLDFLTRHAPTLDQATGQTIGNNVVSQAPDEVEKSMLKQVPGSKVQYLPPSVVSPLLVAGSTTSSVSETRARRSNDRASVPGKLAPAMHASHESTKAPNWNKICFFWYHYGDCTRDPNSPTFNGSTTLCRFFHFIDAGMENVGLQRIPPKIHKDLGDCQLPRCPRSSNYDMQQYSESANNQPKTSGGKKSKMQAPQPPPSAPSTDKASLFCRRNRRQKKSSGSNKETLAAGSSLTLAIMPGKRKASEISGEPAEKALKKKKKKKKQKRRGAVMPAQFRDKISPSALALAPVVEPRIEQRTFSIIPATEPEPIPKTAIPTSRKQTCFFWYHGCCSYPGRKCPHLHALTNPPTFVQPPPDYVHREACFRAWCPGDYMWDHLDKRYWHGKDDDDENDDDDDDDEMCLKDDIDIESAEEGETGSEEDDEWYVSGFPDA